MSKLKTVYFFFLLCCVALAIDSQSDDVETNMVLRSNPVTNRYLNCLLEKGPCTTEGRIIKRILPYMIRNLCKHCTEKQKDTLKRIITAVETDRPEMWKLFKEKYDPTDTYFDAFLATV